jgi:hypothetical protein
MPVELSMNWPFLLNDSCPMKLMIYGCVVCSNEKGAAVAIERYEFRTQPPGYFNSLPASSKFVSATKTYQAHKKKGVAVSLTGSHRHFFVVHRLI